MKKHVVWAGLTILLSLGAVNITSAAISDEAIWAWSVPANNQSLTVQWTGGTGNLSLYLVNVADSNSADFDSIFLLTNTGYTSASIYFSTGKASTVESGVTEANSVTLNGSNFYFAYSSDGNNFDFTYKYEELGGGWYRLYDDAGSLTTAYFTTSGTPSAVPVPSSALLLGSSVLGLVGLGSRRKRS